MAAYSYTLTKLLLATRNLLQESTASFWSDAVLTALINEGIKIASEISGSYRTIVSLATTPLTRLVSFTGHKCMAVEYNDVALIKIVQRQIGHVGLDGIEPQYWFEYGTSIGIEPIPTAAYSLTAYIISAPTILDAAGEVPDVPLFLHGSLPYYAVGKALEKEGKITASLELLDMFYNEINFASMMLIPTVPDGTEDVRFK